MDTAAMNTAKQRRLPDLLADLVGQTTVLFRSEVRLARAEMSEKISQVTSGMALAVAGAVLLMPALVILMGSAVTALVNNGMTDTMATLLVGGGALLLGVILLWIGFNRLRVENLAPQRTLEQLQQDASLAKDQVTS
jgi:hypothetical protein